MGKYVYQIQGALENAQGSLLGLRVLVCDLNNFESVDVPVEVIDPEIKKYLQFRLSFTDATLNIQRLPNEVQNKIRAQLGPWLDYWVCKNFYGYIGDGKSTNA
jgi:hypothetical protein